MDMWKVSKQTSFFEAIRRLHADGTTTTSHEHFNPTRQMSWKTGVHAHRTPRRHRHNRDLAALLLPTLVQAKAKAHSAKCKSNLRQIGVGLRLYLDDYHAYPTWYYPSSSGTLGNSIWRQVLNPYVGYAFYTHGLIGPNAELSSVSHNDFLQCPTVYTKFDPVLPMVANQGQSYGYNPWGVGWRSLAPNSSLGLSQGSSVPAVAESAVKVPADMIAFGDAFVDGAEFSAGSGREIYQSDDWLQANMQGNLDSTLPREYFKTAPKRHQGSLNILFCDTHIESIRIKKLFNRQDDSAMRRWNSDNLPHRELIR
jgi:prepilin-type processing-associated H-X9-DG protein